MLIPLKQNTQSTLELAHTSRVLQLQKEVSQLRKELEHYRQQALAAEAASHGRVVFSTAAAVHSFDVQDIVYCQASGNYTTIYTTSADPILISKSLKEIIPSLQAACIRCHQSYLINLSHACRLNKRDGAIFIETALGEIPVARRRKKEVLRLYNSATL